MKLHLLKPECALKNQHAAKPHVLSLPRAIERAKRTGPSGHRADLSSCPWRAHQLHARPRSPRFHVGDDARVARRLQPRSRCGRLFVLWSGILEAIQHTCTPSKVASSVLVWAFETDKQTFVCSHGRMWINIIVKDRTLIVKDRTRRRMLIRVGGMLGAYAGMCVFEHLVSEYVLADYCPALVSPSALLGTNLWSYICIHSRVRLRYEAHDNLSLVLSIDLFVSLSLSLSLHIYTFLWKYIYIYTYIYGYMYIYIYIST